MTSSAFVLLLLAPEMNAEQLERRRMRRRNQCRARGNQADKQGTMPQRQYLHRYSSTRRAGIEPIFMGRVGASKSRTIAGCNETSLRTRFPIQPPMLAESIDESFER